MFPVVFQASRLHVYAVDLTEDLVHGPINLTTLAGLQLWKRGLLEDPAVAVLHDVERGADDAEAI